MIFSVSSELLTEILAKAGISSFQEDEILTAIKNETTHLEAKVESTFEEFYTSDKEQACEKEIEEDDKGISDDHHANESYIEQCFQVCTGLYWFCFHFYFSNFHFQYLIFHIPAYSGFSFPKLNLNFCLVLLHRWLHWQFHYT